MSVNIEFILIRAIQFVKEDLKKEDIQNCSWLKELMEDRLQNYTNQLNKSRKINK